MAQRQHVQGRVRADVARRLAKAIDDHDWSESQAVEELVDRGLRSMGYTNGGEERGYVETVLRETGKGLLWFGAATLVISLLTVVEIYPIAILFVLLAGVAFGLSAYGDAIQGRVPVGGDPA